MRNKIFLFLGILLAIALIALKLFLNKKASDKEIKAEQAFIPFMVEATTVQVMNSPTLNNYPGTIEPSKTITVLTQTDGRVTGVHVAKGSPVQAGQLIATLRNELKTQTHQINQLNYEKARIDYERIQSLNKENNATGVELENARHTLSTAEKQLGISKTDLGYTTVHAPISGIVTEKFVNAGDVLASNAQVATIIALQNIELRVYVPESEIARVQVGQQVGFTVDSYTGYSFTGKIMAIIPQATQAKVFPVVIKAVNNQHGLLLMAGMSANVSFTTSATTIPLVIPRIAIRGDYSAPYVWLVGKNKKAIRRSFRMGRELEDQVEVIAGLNAGDVIVTKGQSNITEGLTLASLKMAAGNERRDTLTKH